MKGSRVRKILALGLGAIVVASSLVACSKEESVLKQEYEASGYKKLTVYKEYRTNFQNFSSFEKTHGHMTIESSDGGANVVFKGFYQMKCVYIGTEDLAEAFRTNTVKEFAEICGYQDYEKMASNPLFQCTSSELFNYKNYVVCFEKLGTGGANLYLGKKFEYTFENDESATSVYNRVMELLRGDEYDEFDYEQTKDEYGNIKQAISVPYSIVLGLDNGEEDAARDVLVGDTNYNYNIYLEMEEFLISLDKDCSDVLEKLKNDNVSKSPHFK